ncbi:CMGC/CDK/CDC2 protein kinase [Gigaspora margarita]|uniref:Cyclin-dependent kinase 1 n=2 Tax=Gigaspora margarita TaxID=4874 RepID=A0A8H3X107_GIGMA|nr:CMGC/CDK/CDC2 protein kinase [Gigaspora margarita]
MEMDDFEKLEKVGEGTYGVVYRAKEKKTGRIVALKQVRLDLPAGEEEGIPPTSLREISLLKECSKNENIVKYVGITIVVEFWSNKYLKNFINNHYLFYNYHLFFWGEFGILKTCKIAISKYVLYFLNRLLDIINQEKKLFLVFEFLTMDLKRYIQTFKEGLELSKIQKLMYQLLDGTAFLHRRRIFHRDLKPQNLLIDKDGNLKLADFGLARAVGIPLKPYTHGVITLWYKAPELMLGSPTYTFAVDIWSIGCIFAEIVNREVLFKGESEIDELFLIFQALGTPDESVWPGISQFRDYNPIFPRWKPQPLSSYVPTLNSLGIDLLSKMLTYDDTFRISAKRALVHPFFNVTSLGLRPNPFLKIY